ncbi:MAG: BspA family leucine-rich repeat surface protein, partial [Lachnospiraceae bacterium]
GCTSGAGIVQTYNYDSLSRTGGGSTFTPYQYAPSPVHDDESDGFISLLQVSDFGEVLPLKSKTQPNKNADNAWDFVITGEASNASELTAGYVTDNTGPETGESGSAAESSYSLKKSVPKAPAETKSSATDTGTSEKSESSAESSAPAETESQAETPDAAESSKEAESSTESSAEAEPSAAGLLDEVLGVQDAGAEEGTKTYGVNFYTMQLTDDLFILEGEDLKAGDYQFDSIPYIKIQGVAAAADLDEPNVTVNAGTGEWTVSGAETLTWKPGNAAIEGLTVYYKAGDGEWQEYDYEGNKGALAGAGINGVTAIRAEYKSYYGYAAVQVFTNIDIIKTQHVMDIIGDKSSVTLWNVDSYRAYDSEGHLRNAHDVSKYGGTLRDHLAARDEAYKAEDAAAAYTESMKQGILDGTLIEQHDFDNIELTKAFIESKASKNVTYTNDTANQRVTADYTLEAYLTGQSDYKSVLSELITRQKDDTFYDLLPMGMTYAKDSAVANLISQTSVFADVTVEQIANWRDTGRTMLIFHVSTKNGQNNYNDKYQSGYTLKFKAYYPWEDIQEYGRTPRNSFAYKSSEGSIAGFPDDGGRILEGAYLAELDGIESDVKDTVYADTNKSLIFNTASVNGYSKKVKAPEDEGYMNHTTVFEGGDYTYRLRYGSEANTTSSGIILYDVLENNYGSNEYWKGTLKSIDTTVAENKGIQPVVYYSTAEGIVITNELAPDLTDESVWSRTAPEDLKDVTAIAVDLSAKQDGTPFVLEANAAVSVIINMTAPLDGVAYEENGTLAYNTSWIKATTKNTASTTETTAVTQSDATTVAIKAPSVIVEKVNDGGPEDDTFELTLSISGASANTEYPVAYSGDETGEKAAVLTTDADGNGTYTGTLKGGESYSVKLPMGTKYTVSEEPGSGYTPSYIVTGEYANIVKVGDKAEAGEMLSTKEETIDETVDVTVTFTNNSTIRRVEIWKQIYGRYEQKSDHIYDFELAVTGKAGDAYDVTKPDGTEDTIILGLDGKAVYPFSLKGAEAEAAAEKLIVALPVGATYQVTERMAEDYGQDYKPSYSWRGNGIFVSRNGKGEAGESLATAVETADEEDAKVVTLRFTNTGIPAKLSIEKKVAGNDADINKQFEYTVHFTGLTPGEKYDLDGSTYPDYPEETPEGLTMFIPGMEFNLAVKTRTGAYDGSESDEGDDHYWIPWWYNDEVITSFIRSDTEPAEGMDPFIASTDDSSHEILAWVDGTTVYWYSEAETVYMNYSARMMFAEMNVLQNISGLKDIDTSYTADMSYIFGNAKKLSDISALGGWNVSGVTNMDSAFYGMSNIKNISALADWDVSNVTNME